MSGPDDRLLATQPEGPDPLTVVCWAFALAGGALIVAMAPNVDIYRCPDGWTSRGQMQWWLTIAVLVFDAPALGRAAWLVIGHRGSARLRWAAVAVAVAVPVMAVALVVGLLPDTTVSRTCFD